MAKKQNAEAPSQIDEVFTPEEQKEFIVELQKEKRQKVNEELLGMVKQLESMHARCGQLQKIDGSKFPFVMQTNLKACIARVNMFAKEVK